MELKKEMLVMEVIEKIIEIYGKGRSTFKIDSDETGAMVAVIKGYNYNQGKEFQEHKKKILHRCSRLTAKKNKMKLKHFIVSMEGVFFYVEDANES